MHAVVIHLEVGDAAALAFARLQRHEVVARVFTQRAQFVQLGVEAGRDHAAVADQHGRVFHQRLHQPLVYGGMFANELRKFAHAWGLDDGKLLMQRGQQAERVAQLREVARTRRLQRHARENALDVADAAQHVVQRLIMLIFQQHTDGVLAAL